MRKNIFKYAFMAACATVLLAACSKEEKIEVGDWNSTSDYAVVSFVETNKTIELDPTESTTYTLHMSRRNPELSEAIEAEEKRVEELLQKEGLSKEDSTTLITGLEEAIAKMSKANLPAIEVPIVITDDGGNETFTISPAKFEEGEWVGEYTISFPKAEVGTPYSVQYAVQDPQYVSYYSNDVTATFSVTRVKWNPAGYVLNPDGSKKEGWAMYTEDFITGIYSVENVSYPVEVEERDDMPGMYRIKNAYDGKYPYNDPGDWDDTQDYYIVINATNPNRVYMTPSDFHLGLAWSYGAFEVRNLAGYYVANGSDASDYYGKLENGAITFPESSFYIGMDDYNGGGFRWYANPNGAFKLLLDPSQDKYVTSLNLLGEEGDFKWEEVFSGVFNSGQITTDGAPFTNNATLYKATCTVDTDKADSLFAEAYGTPYVIEAPYAEGYDIYFFVKNGRISMPADFDEDFGLQPIGKDDNAGHKIYAKINASSSSFSENEVILNMTFNNATESIFYGTSDESLAYITWSKVATGTFYYVMFSSTDDPEPDPGYELFKRDDKDNVYKIPDWLMGTDFMFTWDKATNKCVVLEQPIDYNHPTYGPMYILEGALFNSSSYGENTSYYDPATKVFHFFPVYFVDAGSFGQVEEFFEITEEAGVKQLVPVWNSSKLKANDRKSGIWKGRKVAKKMSKKSQFTIKTPSFIESRNR